MNAASVALTIAGSDSGANAGIQADLLTFAANGVFGTSAITCLTAQNPDGITRLHPVPAENVAEQILQVLRYHKPKALKTGMLFNSEIIKVVARILDTHHNIPAIVDPVMVATSGALLLDQQALGLVKSHLLPSAALITPNLDEAAVLLGQPITGPGQLEDAARALASTFKTSALLKGGHLQGDELVDVLATADGEVKRFRQTRIHDVDTHGSGCTLSAAIAAGIAKGLVLPTAVESARAYLRRGMTRPVWIEGKAFINHFA